MDGTLVNGRDKPPEDSNIEAGRWIARLNADDTSQADIEAWREWITQSPRNKTAYEAMERTWDLTGSLELPVERSALSPAAIARASQPSGPGRRMVLFGGGALLLGAGLFFAGTRPAEALQLRTRVGEQRSVTLSNGARLLLDTNSHARFERDWMGDSLTVLQGRVSLQMSPDNAGRMEVRSDQLAIRAGHCSLDFAVEEGASEIFLIDGGPVSVRLSQGDEISLKPGERCRFDGQNLRNWAGEDPSRLGAWRHGQLIFDNEKLGSAVMAFNRYSPLQLVISDSQISENRISGTFEANDSEGFARAVTLMLPIAILRNGNRVYLSHRDGG